MANLHIIEPGVLPISREILEQLIKKEYEKKDRQNKEFFAAALREEIEFKEVQKQAMQYYREKETEEKQTRKEEEKHQQQVKEDHFRIAVQQAAQLIKTDPFDKKLQELGALTFKQEAHEIWRTEMSALAKAATEKLSNPLEMQNEALQSYLTALTTDKDGNTITLQDKMQQVWQKRSADMQEALATRGSLEDVARIVPQFKGKSMEKVSEEFAPTQKLNSMAIPAAQMFQLYAELDRELKKQGTSLKTVLGKSAVQLGVEWAEQQFRPDQHGMPGPLQSYQAKLEIYSINFSKAITKANEVGLEEKNTDESQPRRTLR